MATVPNTNVRMSHALTLRVGSRVCGAVHAYAPSSSRRLEDVFEVEVNAVGKPREIIPGPLESRELRVSRYDLYLTVMEEIFGSTELINLTDQTRPFTLREAWVGPGLAGALSPFTPGLNAGGQIAAELAGGPLAGSVPGGALQGAVATGLGVFGAGRSRRYEYVGCWFANIGRQIDAKGERVISVDATIIYTDRQRVQ